MVQWFYESIYTAVGEFFAEINSLGVEIFDLSWVQAVVQLFTLLGSFDIDDLILNLIGMTLGFIGYHLFRKKK